MMSMPMQVHLSEKSGKQHGDGASSWICDYIMYSKLGASDTSNLRDGSLLHATQTVECYLEFNQWIYSYSYVFFETVIDLYY